MLFEYLLETYGQNEPIFVSDIRYMDWSTNYIRQQIKKLTDEGKLRRYDTGIYFIPKPSPFRSGSQLSRKNTSLTTANCADMSEVLCLPISLA